MNKKQTIYKFVLMNLLCAFVLQFISTPLFARETPELNMFPDARYHEIMDTFAEKAELNQKGYYYNMTSEIKVDLANILNILYTYSEVTSKRHLPEAVLRQYEYPTEKIILESLASALKHLNKSTRMGRLADFGNTSIPLRMIMVLSETINEHVEDFHIRDHRIKQILVPGLTDAVENVIRHEMNREQAKNRHPYLEVTENSIQKLSVHLTPQTFFQKMTSKIPVSLSTIKGRVLPQKDTGLFCPRLFNQSR